MSFGGFGQDIADMRAGLRSRVDRALAMVRRAAPGPTLVRGGVYLSGLIAMLTAWPATFVLGRGLLVAVILALVPVLWPRGFAPTLVILLAVTGWLAATTGYAEPVTYLRLVIVAGALYLLHTLAALAGVLPYDAIVSAGVLGRWLLRAALVWVLTAGLALFAVAVPQQVGAGGYLVASLAGLGLVSGVTAYLANLTRRR
ncbi:MAG TPA: hypothetical protein VJT31_08740 [Rugosimonospora sp.]|nr:hypothetical protein [Rugosimonospora sp.]